MKKFDIPAHYRSSFISTIKNIRKEKDPRKQDFTPTKLNFGKLEIIIARHFGFCYGVENAIEISYKAIEENPDKRIFLLSQMIHNPHVNQDLQEQGLNFIMDTEGNLLMDWNEIKRDDVVIIPAFGTTVEIEQKLQTIGVDIQKYNTTCPFVEKVWKMSSKLGNDDYTVIIHGKSKHEETRATFSHAKQSAKSIIVKDINEAKIIGEIILGKRSKSDFSNFFEGIFSTDFDIEQDLNRVGVVNQTTMLATETQEIADYFKQVMLEKYGAENIKNHFADTRDTLCYATNDNQQATYGLLKEAADLAIVVGGYNSSNTSHLVELCEEKLTTYYISSVKEFVANNTLQHWDFRNKKLITSTNVLPQKEKVKIMLTSGASCPDKQIDEVLEYLLDFYNIEVSKENLLEFII